MNSELVYTSITRTENDDGLTPPPPTPRQGRFALSKESKWALALIVIWTLLMLLAKKRLDPYVLSDNSPAFPPAWYDYTVMFFSMVYLTMIVLTLGGILLRRYRLLLRRQRLFSDGVATVAIVTFVGVIRGPSSHTPTFCVVVRWSFNVDGIECTGVTPRDELPNVTVGDRFWVLYEEENPWYARRWALFDTEGNLRSNDFLPWKLGATW